MLAVQLCDAFNTREKCRLVLGLRPVNAAHINVCSQRSGVLSLSLPVLSLLLLCCHCARTRVPAGLC